MDDNYGKKKYMDMLCYRTRNSVHVTSTTEEELVEGRPRQSCMKKIMLENGSYIKIKLKDVATDVDEQRDI